MRPEGKQVWKIGGGAFSYCSFALSSMRFLTLYIHSKRLTLSILCMKSCDKGWNLLLLVQAKNLYGGYNTKR